MKKTAFKDTPVKTSDLAERYTISTDNLVKPVDSSRQNSALVEYTKLREMAEKYSAQHDDVEAALQMLPDLNLVCETLNASILSPKDFREFELNLIGESFTPPGILEAARNHFTTVYDLNEEIPNWLDMALCKRGSHIVIPISPKSITAMIKAGTPGLEELDLDVRLSSMNSNNIGILRKDPKHPNGELWGMESLSEEILKKDNGTGKPNYIEITDNWLHALRPSLIEALAKERLDKVVENAYGLEEDVTTDPTAYTTRVYHDNYTRNIPTAIFAPLSEADCDSNKDLNPIVLTPPAGSVIPVHVPGEPKKHLGYYIPLDEDGNIIHLAVSSSKYKELNEKLNTMVKDQSSMSLLSTGVKYIGTEPQTTNDSSKVNKQLLQLYEAQFEYELCQAVAKGKTGRMVEISNPGELFRIMLFRQMGRQRTRVLYVPASMVMYMAFNYNENGVGESLLERTQLYTAFRVVLTFATILAAVKGSVNMRTVEIIIDDNDPDPRATGEMLVNEFMGMQTSSIPIASLRPVDIIDGLAKSGVQVKIKGAPERIPQTSMDVEDKKRDIAPPDKDVMDWLKDTQYAGMMVSPEIMDRVLGAELAVSVATVSLLQAKRVIKIHKPLISCANMFMRSYIKLGGPLFQEIKKLYQEAKVKDKTLFQVIDSISMSLPQPDTAVITTQIEAFDKQLEFVEKVVNVTINEEMITSLLKGDLVGTSAPAIKQGIINLLMRDYIKKENLIPEMESLLNDADSNLSELVGQHYDRVIVLVEEIARKIGKTEFEEDETTKKFNEKNGIGQTEDENQDNTDDAGDGSMDDGGEGLDGGDDFGDDTGLDMGDEDGNMGDVSADGDNNANPDGGDDGMADDNTSVAEPNLDGDGGNDTESVGEKETSEETVPPDPEDSSTEETESGDDKTKDKEDTKPVAPVKPKAPPVEKPVAETTKFTDKEDNSKLPPPEPKEEPESVKKEDDGETDDEGATDKDKENKDDKEKDGDVEEDDTDVEKKGKKKTEEDDTEEEDKKK